jgi:hypothetical protein
MTALRHDELSGKREFSYIQPRQGRRTTEYEELTLYVQQDPKQFAWAGWTMLSPEGRPAWVEESTALRCGDWCWGLTEVIRHFGYLRPDGKTLMAQPSLNRKRMWTIEDIERLGYEIKNPLRAA